MISHKLAVVLDGGEATALADIVRALPAPASQEVGASVWQQAGVSCVSLPSRGGLWLNHVIGLGLQRPASAALVEEVLERPHRREVPFVVKLNPFAQPEDLPAWLAARGVREIRKQCKLGRDMQEPITHLATDLAIRQIGPAQAHAFAEIVIAEFALSPQLHPIITATVGRPGWYHFMAFDQETPAATGALFLHARTGWLGMDSTRVPFRRRGAQGAIIAARVQTAAEAGCRWLTTDTRPDTPDNPNPSLHNMLRNGFFPAYERENYVMEASRSK